MRQGIAKAGVERDYSHRDVIDKLGIKPGQLVAFDETARAFDPQLRRRILDRAGDATNEQAREVDVVMCAVDAGADAEAILAGWRRRIRPAGCIWLLTPKRGHPGYLDQTALIPAGKGAGLVDNKVCSVSESMSAIRFVIRKLDRPK